MCVAAEVVWWAYLADKFAGGVASYLLRLGADAVLNRLKEPLEGQKEQEALRRTIGNALKRFEQRYPQLAQSFFDDTFIQSRGSDEISKFIAQSIRDVPDAQSLPKAFSQ